MILSGPTQAVIAPPPPTLAQVQVMTIIFDLTGHISTINYGGTGPGQLKTVSGNIPGALLNALEAYARTQIENDQGWAANSSTVVTP